MCFVPHAYNAPATRNSPWRVRDLFLILVVLVFVMSPLVACNLGRVIASSSTAFNTRRLAFYLGMLVPIVSNIGRLVAPTSDTFSPSHLHVGLRE